MIFFVSCFLKRKFFSFQVDSDHTFSEIKCATAIRFCLDRHTHSIFWQQVFYQLRPFDETDGSAVDIVFVAHIIYFLQLLDTLEVQMINQAARGVTLILIDDGKCGRSNHVAHT